MGWTCLTNDRLYEFTKLLQYNTIFLVLPQAPSLTNGRLKFNFPLVKLQVRLDPLGLEFMMSTSTYSWDRGGGAVLQAEPILMGFIFMLPRFQVQVIEL